MWRPLSSQRRFFRLTTRAGARRMTALLLVVSLPADVLLVLLPRASAYVLQFENRFSVVISDEHYEQVARSAVSTHRTIDSEMLYIWIANDRAWLSVRNVVKVDGRPVAGSEQRLDRLLDSGAPVGIGHLRRLRDESARFNIGSIHRNFNDPLLPLRFLEPDGQARFSFSAVGDESIDHVVTHKVKFDERTRPTIIQDNGVDRPSNGVMWIADNGAVWRTELDVASDSRLTTPSGSRVERLKGSIVVQYRQDAHLAMLVPTRMHETYRAMEFPWSVGRDEDIKCEATYSNFRRFETSVRIVPN